MAETKFIRTTGVHLTFTVEQDDLFIPHQTTVTRLTITELSKQ